MTDYISRADAICEVLVNDGIDNIVDRINALPSADAEQEAVPTVVRVTMSDGSQYYLEHERDAIQADAVHGEWIEVEDYNGDVHYKCDQCGEEWTFPFGTPKENNANFCPNCGARMENK